MHRMFLLRAPPIAGSFFFFYFSLIITFAFTEVSDYNYCLRVGVWGVSESVISFVHVDPETELRSPRTFTYWATSLALNLISFLN